MGCPLPERESVWQARMVIAGGWQYPRTSAVPFSDAFSTRNALLFTALTHATGAPGAAALCGALAPVVETQADRDRQAIASEALAGVMRGGTKLSDVALHDAVAPLVIPSALHGGMAPLDHVQSTCLRGASKPVSVGQVPLVTRALHGTTHESLREWVDCVRFVLSNRDPRRYD